MTALGVSAHIVVPDADAAARWYADAFGAREVGRVPLPGERVMSVELRIGDSAVHLGSEFPAAGIVSPLTIGGTATVLQIATDDADALWQRAIDAGASIQHPLADQFWGERHGQLTDPFGHRWNVAERIRDVSPDEVAAAAGRGVRLTLTEPGGDSTIAPRLVTISRDGFSRTRRADGGEVAVIRAEHGKARPRSGSELEVAASRTLTTGPG